METGIYSVFGGREIPFLRIIEKPTPVERASFGNLSFAIKREDLTDSRLYGGNKVRNMEFLLAEAVQRNFSNLYTSIPIGSNFSAAMTVHAKKAGLEATLYQLDLAEHQNILDHDRFCKEQGAVMRPRRGPWMYMIHAADLVRESLRRRSRFIAPGGSSIRGAVGHFRAMQELVSAIRRGDAAETDYIFVGGGTGGTTAGLLAGITAFGLKSRLVVIPCAAKILCNHFRLQRMAQRVLKFLGLRRRIDGKSWTLLPHRTTYGHELGSFQEIYDEFYARNSIHLDRTYTSKVVAGMRDFVNEHQLATKNLLYWHTFSPLAERSAVNYVKSQR